MSLERDLSYIFLKYLNELIYVEFYLEEIIKLINKQSEGIEDIGIWKSFTDTIINAQNSLLLKIIHIYIITVFETFNKDFFEELKQHLSLRSPNFSITPSKMVLFFYDNFKIDLKTDFKSWLELKENICRRHVIAHNMGIIDQKYITCVNATVYLKGKKIGKEITHDFLYLKKTKENVGNFMIYTFKNVITYFSLKNIRRIVKTLVEKNFEDINPNLLDDVNI